MHTRFSTEQILCPVFLAIDSGFSSHIAIQDEVRAVSYSDLGNATSNYVQSLSGIPSGSRIGVSFSIGIEALPFLFACLRLNICVVFLNPGFPDAMTDAIQSDLKLFAFFRQIPAFKTGKVSAQSLNPIHYPFHQPAVIILTSGSSGKANYVQLSVGQLLRHAMASNQRVNIEAGDQWLLSLPCFHVSGLSILFRCVLARATVVVNRDLRKDLTQILYTSITHVSMVPTQLKRLLSSNFSNAAAVSKLKSILIGGAPISSELVSAALSKGLPLQLSYGMSEMGSQVCTTTLSDSLVPVHFGRPLDGFDVKINEDGRICVKGPSLFEGYLRDEFVVLDLDRDGYFVTSDIGVIDENSHLFVRGRADRMFISGGENVFPEEIEAVLMSYPDLDGARIGVVDNTEFGQVAVGYLKAADGFDLKDLESFLALRLPRYKIPKTWSFLDSDQPGKQARLSDSN